jgi:hypothetical protein
MARGQVPVFLDGGVRRGTDAFKALDLGAAGLTRSDILEDSLISGPSIGSVRGYHCN